MRQPEPTDEDTIRLIRRPVKPPILTRRRILLTAAGAAGGALLLREVAVLVWPPHPAPVPVTRAVVRAPAPPIAAERPTPPPAPPEFHIRTATEAQILADLPTSLTVFRFALDSRILVLDFPSLHEQGLMLNRVAALIEKAGEPRNRVVTEAALDKAIRAGGDTPATYYYGHDYSAASLQKFFTLVHDEHLTLDPEEQKLYRLVLQVGWLHPGVNAGLISIPAVGANRYVTLSARAAILHHELSHGYFFSDPAYAAFVHRFWDTALTAAERDAVRRFLGSEGYDTHDEVLMYNEMQAYLMFTRNPEFFTPSMVGMTPQRLADLQEAFLRGMPRGWLYDVLAATPLPAPVAQPTHAMSRAVHLRHANE